MSCSETKKKILRNFEKILEISIRCEMTYYASKLIKLIMSALESITVRESINMVSLIIHKRKWVVFINHFTDIQNPRFCYS
ncbi:hypothetical protein KUTeg_009904 [Tegillarca granosa]|uniref:Uncharacterized protein n=1 Tax=Tegillarca granosa TaxID=220873 RepID=A0ABQ9F583_TEGGR|nr:hypothetical protein KUTeg_009904 [Tegillarca granosa]